MSETTDSVCGFPTYKPYCLECKEPLLMENAWMSDGCPCNSKPGCNTINGTRWRLLRDLQQQQSDALAAATKRAEEAEAKLAQSTNYVADDDTYPTCVWFANGRVVSVNAAGVLEIRFGKQLEACDE